jgi:hypothetical protein
LQLAQLSERYEPSHMPVREALRELNGEGLVVLEHNQGAHVRGVDADFLETLFEVRSAVEALVARRAAERINAEELALLAASEASLERHAAAGDAPHAHGRHAPLELDVPPERPKSKPPARKSVAQSGAPVKRSKATSIPMLCLRLLTPSPAKPAGCWMPLANRTRTPTPPGQRRSSTSVMASASSHPPTAWPRW